MRYYTAEEIFSLITSATYSAELQPLVEKLRSDGGFSNRLAGLIDRMQNDEKFLHRIIQGKGASIQIGQSNFLPAHEIFALEIAAQFLNPKYPFPSEPVSLKVAPSVESLGAKFEGERLDPACVRKEKTEEITKVLAKDKSFLALVVNQPALAIGLNELNRSEFFMIYIQAAFLHMAFNKTREMTISSDFLKIIGLSETEFKSLMETFFGT